MTAVYAELEPNPHAAVFPMLTDAELQELANDIAAHGMRHPIVLDGQGRVLDGRNRPCRVRARQR
jgi:ParB-like chromosome segregation protein Spo0J